MADVGGLVILKSTVHIVLTVQLIMVESVIHQIVFLLMALVSVKGLHQMCLVTTVTIALTATTAQMKQLRQLRYVHTVQIQQQLRRLLRHQLVIKLVKLATSQLPHTQNRLKLHHLVMTSQLLHLVLDGMDVQMETQMQMFLTMEWAIHLQTDREISIL